MPVTDPRALVIKQTAIANETERLTQLTCASAQAQVNDNAPYVAPLNRVQVEQDVVTSIAAARLTAQTSLVAALNAL